MADNDKILELEVELERRRQTIAELNLALSNEKMRTNAVREYVHRQVDGDIDRFIETVMGS